MSLHKASFPPPPTMSPWCLYTEKLGKTIRMNDNLYLVLLQTEVKSDWSSDLTGQMKVLVFMSLSHGYLMTK